MCLLHFICTSLMYYFSFTEANHGVLCVNIDSNKCQFCSGKWKDLDKRALGWLFLNALAGYLMHYPMVLCTSNMKSILPSPFAMTPHRFHT
jgi:hypothetical protein